MGWAACRRVAAGILDARVLAPAPYCLLMLGPSVVEVVRTREREACAPAHQSGGEAQRARFILFTLH